MLKFPYIRYGNASWGIGLTTEDEEKADREDRGP